MYRIRPGCAEEARINSPADQARRMMYKGELYRIRPGCAAEARINSPADQARRMMYRGEML